MHTAHIDGIFQWDGPTPEGCGRKMPSSSISHTRVSKRIYCNLSLVSS
jgi:hypothetical protein